MATDVEESDTDDHERPVPPKRQRTRCIKVDENYSDTDNHTTSDNSEHTIQDAENVELEDVKRREKLRRWQACQVATGVVDNTINNMLEDLIPNESFSVEETEFRLLRESDMENTAVMMAIRNHGLVSSRELFPTPNNRCRTAYWSNAHVSYCSSSNMQDTGGFSNSIASSSAKSLAIFDPIEVRPYIEPNSDIDEIATNDQQEDFLERAVEEAIKKKGLSALSVDYG
ncbi:PREDICTED: uncharacterized protein LOC107069406 [Polistes dominula]|uniref:Uncharacterized protein LOC107069406 n=1 Tax=Polistes dominula TaxID=743375 RepID=A0ABM1IPQ1_POLDO|nr:PREDICTED: uncharacterized protein LOC107069406 [Polistes dominula]XP_015182189.1 PREDICTED: uncharacterized protein LOC107069406 [Polistes dominula]XP_015182191.1 PREDICTED: uncharacterized protein LOC107069406 [Polistes dominula]